jgi:4-amino-4-deoxy-L-arabinose transferase-like glycosyltransferase
VLAAELFPWTPVALLLFSKRLYEDQRVRFLLACFAFGFVFFSASRGKLPGYLLPLLPPMAALLGLALDQARERSAIVICVLAASAGLLGLVPTAQEALPEALVSGLARAPIQFFLNAWLILVALSIPASILLERRGKRGLAAVLIAALTTILVARFVWQDFPALDRGVSARGPWVTYAESIACVPRDRQFLRYGLNYYAQRALPDCN